MKILILDDDKISNVALLKIGKPLFGNNIYAVEDMEYFKYLVEPSSSLVVVISVCSKKINYIDTVQLIRKQGYKAVIWFTADREDELTDSDKSLCDGYFIKPYTEEKLKNFAEDVIRMFNRMKRVNVKTFGKFEVEIDNQIIDFHNSKAKELFALCVDRKGESISIEEATSLIWSHRIYDNRLKCLYRKAVLSIKKTLALYQASDVFQNKRGSCRIDQNRINCDYYTLIKNPERYANLFEGIYMYEYSWAESTCADIYKLLSKYRQHSKETSDFIL